MHLAIAHFANHKSRPEFEASLTKSLTPEEVKTIVTHFKKEVYPLDKKVVLWMWSNWGGSYNFNFKTSLKMLKKMKAI